MKLSRRKFLKKFAAAAGSLLAAPSLYSYGKSPENKPNFIIIFTDDQGYQDLGCYGSPLIKTPNLDRMAEEGIRFTDFYSASPICSPSRAALLTGCYPPRVSIPDVLFPGDERGHIVLNPDEITIADLLKRQGYATTCIGKWHLGHKTEFLPTQQGFDSYYGIPYSNDMYMDPEMKLADDIKLNKGMTPERIRKEEPKQNWVPLMRDEEVIEYPCDQTNLTKQYTEKAVEFIKENKNKPFFLYLPHTMPHVPLFASKAFKGKSKRGLYGDVIEEIDSSVGEILKTLKELNLDDNTLVIFTSDNGPWLEYKEQGGCALPLRNGKFTTYEGGMRMPCIMRWPTKIPAGTVCSEVAATIDFLPTLASLAGAAAPDDRIIDGKDIWPLMITAPGARSPHEAYFYYSENNLEAVRSGQWKLRKTDTVELYNLREDISETNNLADKHPDIVQHLTETMERFDCELKANTRSPGRSRSTQKQKVKVFILAGQSNMEGHGQLRSLDHLGNHPKYGHLLNKLKNSDGSWIVREDVTISYQTDHRKQKHGPLTVGWGFEPHEIGPELMFGTIMGEHYDEHVLLIKTAWGGKDVYCDFRSPSAGLPSGDVSDFLREERAENNHREIGLYYRTMVSEIKETLAQIDDIVSGYNDQGYEIAGMAWFQGWNDFCQWH
ncbi:MAG: sulfatase-like hydrolase/transferase, partial [Planctomycetota bacterium]